tara:strand:+ start:49 stop:477 length:429 start_codon:yes stop_codon:yes gene_type:complete
VQPAFEKRYQLTLTDQFVEIMSKEIQKKQPDFVRVHDSGDYYSPKYLQKWIDIAIIHHAVKFYSYTNCVKMLKEAKLPDNYDIIFSDSGKQKHLINRKIDRHTKIFENYQELLDNNYINASQIDLYATKWFNRNNKVGLIKH